MNRIAALALAFLVTCLASGEANAERRVALVIGNGAYVGENVPALRNPANDARAIAEKLRTLNFEVIAGLDIQQEEMWDLLTAFDRAADGADLAVFFFAGHGMQVEGENYLLSTDAEINDKYDLRPITKLSDIKDHLSAKANVVFLDACRDNPIPKLLAKKDRSIGYERGLAKFDPPNGSYVVYATAPGATAADGTGPNSPFTTALLEYIDKPGLEVEPMAKAVARHVYENTVPPQDPFREGNLKTDVYFNPASTVETSVGIADGSSGGGAEWTMLQDGIVSLQEENRWNTALSLNTREAFLHYREEYCDSEEGRYCQSASRALAKFDETPDPIGPETDCDRFAADPRDPNRAGPGVDKDDMDKARALRACRAAVRDHPDNLRFAYQLARVLDISGDYEEAAYWFTRAAEQNYPAAQVGLATLYALGQGVSKDPPEAVRWFKMAAEQNYVVAQTKLGLVYSRGIGVPEDPERAFSYFLKAAEQGDPRAQVGLGKLYATGRGVPLDLDKARVWYRKAAAQGYAAAEKHLAEIESQ